MVFAYYIAQFALENSWWLLSKTYNTGYYMIYGAQESVETRLLKQIEEIKKQNEEERKDLAEIKNNMYVMYYQGLKKDRLDKLDNK